MIFKALDRLFLHEMFCGFIRLLFAHLFPVGQVGNIVVFVIFIMASTRAVDYSFGDDLKITVEHLELLSMAECLIFMEPLLLSLKEQSFSPCHGLKGQQRFVKSSQCLSVRKD